MLAHDHRDRRQLGQLVAAEAARGLALLEAEAMAASAAGLWIVVDDLIDLLLGHGFAARAGVAGLSARPPLALAPRPRPRLRARLRAPLRTRLRRILRRRLRAGARTLPRLLLQPAHSLLQPLAAPRQLLAAPCQLEDELDTALPPAVVDHLRVAPLHDAHFGGQPGVPSRLKSIKPSSFAGRPANPPTPPSRADGRDD